MRAKRRMFLKAVLLFLGFTGAAMSAHAETDLRLTTRFIQGSFDILLPDGWVAALTAEGMVMQAQSPDLHKISINARIRNEDELVRAQERHLEKLGRSDLLDVETVSEKRLLEGRLRITVVRPRYNEKSRMGELIEPERVPLHVLASYRSAESGLLLSSRLIIYGQDPLDGRWVDFLVATLESVRVPGNQSRGGPVYRRVTGAPRLNIPEEEDLVGAWRTRRILGTATFTPSSPTDIILGDNGFEQLTLSPDGRYVSEWYGLFLALEAGDMVSRTDEHRETGAWSLRDGVLRLMPREAAARSYQHKKDTGDFLPAPTPPRRYEVTLRNGLPVLRGACPVFAEMQYCEDLYTRGRRVLDFILEPNDEKP